MVLLKQDINYKVNVIGYNDHCVMTVHGVVDAVARIKINQAIKHDGYLGLSSDQVKQACMPRVLRSLVYILFTYLIVHGSTTDDLSSSTVLPIPKDKILNYSDSTNGRV